MRLLKYLILLCSIALISCKDRIETKNIIENVTTDGDEIQADGTTIVTITAWLNNDLDKRSISFQTDKGSLTDSDKGKPVIITAEKINGKLVAITKLRAPVSSGLINITVQPEITDQKGKYVFIKTINATPSEPASIDLIANAFSVHNEFDGEIELNATLTNVNSRGVSEGIKVLLEDYDSNLNRINGAFRNEILSTKSDSKVSANYSPGPIAPEQYIYLVATVLNDSDNKTAIADTLKIYVTKKD